MRRHSYYSLKRLFGNSSYYIAIENYSGELDIILGNLFLLKGKVFDLQGDRRNAIEYYKKCIGLNNLSSAIKESKQYLKKPYTDYGS